MGDIEAEVDPVKFAGECGGEGADRGGISTFRRGKPDKISVGVLLNDREPGRD